MNKSIFPAKYEAINGDGICPVYLHRWTLIKTNSFSVYLHHFVGNDWSIDPHDHPKTFTSIGLWGEYIEDDFTVLDNPVSRLFKAPWFRIFPPEYRHRIKMTNKKSCWTLCIVGKPKREWGFWYKCKIFIPWDAYVRGGPGKERKDC